MARQRAGPGATSRVERRADPTAKVALTERVLADPDLAGCARATLQWLTRHAGVARGLCTVVSDDGATHRGLCGVGVREARVRAFALDLGAEEHPLVLALTNADPAPFRRADRIRSLPDTPLGKADLYAIPLTRPELGPGPAPGLLLLAGLEGAAAPGPDVLWAAELLAARVLCWRHERERAGQRRVQRERGLLRGVIDAVTDPILLTDEAGRILVANARAERLLQADAEESEGLRRAVALNNMLFSATLFTSSHQTAKGRRELLMVDPIDGRDLLFEVLSAAIPTAPVGGAGAVRHDRGVGRDGRDGRDGPGARQATVRILRDVNDLRRATEEIEANYRRVRTAQAEARAERDRLDLIIHAVADPVLVTDPEGEIILMNPPAARLFTLPSTDESAGGPSSEVNDRSGTSRARVRANDAVFSSFVSNLYTGNALRWRGELSLVDPATGASVPVEAIAGMVHAKDPADSATVTILHDRSEAIERAALFEQVKRSSEELKEKVHEATAELVQQNELLRRQAIALEQASELKSRFLANISHELRTPLNAITGYTGLLLQGISGELTPAQRERLRRVDSNAQHLLGLINDLLDIARIESGQMPLNVERFSLSALIEEVMNEIEPLVQRSPVRVAHELDPGLPELETDRQKVKQVLINLLSNALKFTPAGSVAVRAGRDEVGGTVRIAVADTGIGIAAEDQAKVFDAFRQVDGSHTRQYGGTGLGLTICHRLAATLKGELGLESAPGVGSTFTFWIPTRVGAL